VCRIESLLCILFTDTIFSVYLKFGNTIAYLDHNLNHCITLLRAFSAVQLLTLFSSRRNMLKEKSGTCTGRSRLLMLVLVFLSIYSLLVENKILHSVKTPLEPLLQDAVATGDTDALPTVAPYAYPTSPSTSRKVGLSGLDQDQAETEVATSRVELERQDASAEEDALVISKGTIEDDPHIKAQSSEMENVATTDMTTHPLAWQNQTTITISNVNATVMTTTLRPCRVAVTNSLHAFHFETLASIAYFYPLDALNFSLSQCDPQNIQFDYYVYAPVESTRAKEWRKDYKKRLRRTQVSNPQEGNVTRRFGDIHTQKHPINELFLSKFSFDATVEATCYCNPSQVKWLMAENHSCVFHERCDSAVANPRAVWLSPHHKKYYIPTALPGALQRQQQKPKPPNTQHILCVLGDTRRRKWKWLKDYLESTLGAKAAASSRFIIQIVGDHPAPKELRGHRKMTMRENVRDDSTFYKCARRCEAVIMLIDKASQPDYFDIPNGKRKLSGAIPIAIAYKLPVVLHEELYDLYQDYLSPQIHATHSNNATSFNAAMNQLLDALDGNDNKSANMTVPSFSSPEQ
jgi:hypothetical protein